MNTTHEQLEELAQQQDFALRNLVRATMYSNYQVAKVWCDYYVKVTDQYFDLQKKDMERLKD